ncbi:MAG: ribonuclease P protein component [Patescibacteria group bacterium]|nr:MAG: ribonuclease P protein component [Firmicutes bacterium HGW-Firmicutes-8]
MTFIKGLRLNKEFAEVYNKGGSVVNRFLVLYYLPKDQEYTRVGFSVGKKFGNAVKRNRMKRILREICRLHMKQINKGFNCIIIARPRGAGENYQTIEKSFLKLADKARLLRKEMLDCEIPSDSGDPVLS